MKDKDIRRKIQRSLDSIHSIFSQIDMLEELDQHIENEEYENLKTEYETLIWTTYLQIAAFLESNHLNSYLNDFKNSYEDRITKNNIYDRFFHHDSGNTYSRIYLDFFQVLSPFNFSSSETHESQIIKYSLIYLERILKNTDKLLNLQKVKIVNEADIYNPIKPFIEIFFPSIINSSGSAIFSKLKKYKPDILIPELKTAVEYKYIKSNKDIQKTISEIADDVIGYKDKIGTNDYVRFYCVYYLKKHFVTKERFIILWKEREYPENWKPIIVFERT